MLSRMWWQWRMSYHYCRPYISACTSMMSDYHAFNVNVSHISPNRYRGNNYKNVAVECICRHARTVITSCAIQQAYTSSNHSDYACCILCVDNYQYYTTMEPDYQSGYVNVPDISSWGYNSNRRYVHINVAVSWNLTPHIISKTTCEHITRSRTPTRTQHVLQYCMISNL